MKKYVIVALMGWFVIVEQTTTNTIPCPGQDLQKQPVFTVCAENKTQLIDKTEWKDKATAQRVSDLLLKFKIQSRLEEKK